MVTERSGVSMRPTLIEGFVSFIPLFSGAFDEVPLPCSSESPRWRGIFGVFVPGVESADPCAVEDAALVL
jgi:hypothetical protein